MFKKVLSGLLFITFFAFLVSCKNEVKIKKGLLDFDSYKNVKIEEIERIDVSWDKGDNKPIEFSFDDKNKIKEVINELCKEDEFIKNDSMVDGGHSSITLIDKEDNKNVISLYQVVEGDICYIYSNNVLLNIIENIGVEQNVLTK